MYTIQAVALGFLLDVLLGDPYSFPHPVRLMGRGITSLEKFLYPKAGREKEKVFRGGLLVFLLLAGTVLVSGGLLYLAYFLHPVVGFFTEAFMCYQMLAARCLVKESQKVYAAVKSEDIEEARKKVAGIVGRDTENLDKEGIIRAAVETVAENTSDGVVAPLVYMLLGGPVAGFFYKAVNTMDSMLGYKNDRYLYFGRVAAKLDDVLNLIPSRISGIFMVAAACILPGCSGKKAGKIFFRDRYRHASPNSAQTEAACAGALGVQLAGDSYYFGKKVEKPYIGDADRTIEAEDINRANRLMYVTSLLVLFAGSVIRFWLRGWR